jgi:hypothetical protein
MRKALRYAGLTILYSVIGACIIFIALLTGKIISNPSSVRAASSIFYPSFCLGGWSNPQNASGQPSLSPSDPSSAYDNSNSAYLGSSISSQLFCGYFSANQQSHPPTAVVVQFQWAMSGDGISTSTDNLNQNINTATTTTFENTNTNTNTESNSSDSGYIIATSTGFYVTEPTSPTSTSQQNFSTSTTPSTSSTTTSATSTSSSGNTSNNTSGNTNPTTASTTPTTSVAPGSSTATSISSVPTTPPSTTSTSSASSSVSSQTPPPSNNTSSNSSSSSTTNSDSSSAAATDSSPPPTPPAPVPTPPTPTVAPAPAPSSDSSSDAGPTSFIERIMAIVAAKAEAQTGDPSHSSDPFLQISYSTDGVRWVSIGTVGTDNWQNYKIAIPISSWDDLNNLQIMVSTLPTVSEKPDIYLDGMYARVSYDRTLVEALSDTLASAADAVDSVINPTPDPAPVVVAPPAAPPAPLPPIVITKKVMSFASNGDPVDGEYKGDTSITTTPGSDGSSFVVSGKCSRKYFVILVYHNQSDYEKKPSSYIANSAFECDNGSFNYDLSGLPLNVHSGDYWLLTAEEDDTGGWTPVSRIFPITITSTTTTETINQ